MVDYTNRPCLDNWFPEAGLCILCDAPAQVDLCAGCESDLPYIKYPCPSCGLPVREGRGLSCGRCQVSRQPFQRCIVPLAYSWPVDALVAGFKTGGKLPYGRMLSRQLAGAVRVAYANDRLPHRLVATPLQGPRLKRRGFNQAVQVARFLGSQFSIPVDADLFDCLRAVDAQKTLSARKRRANLRGAFGLRQPVHGHLGLIDDIMTTGATASALAETLLKGGADRVDVWCLARTPAPRWRSS